MRLMILPVSPQRHAKVISVLLTGSCGGGLGQEVRHLALRLEARSLAAEAAARALQSAAPVDALKRLLMLSLLLRP